MFFYRKMIFKKYVFAFEGYTLYYHQISQVTTLQSVL